MSREAAVAVAYDCLFPYSTGGGERQYRAVAAELVARGRRVDYLTARQWQGPTPSDAFDIVPVCSPLTLYSPDGVRRVPPALRFAAGLFRALARRRHTYDAVIVSGLPVFNVFATRLALLGSGTKIVVDYLEVWHLPQWIEYTGRLAGTIAWLLQRLAIGMTPIATCHSQLSAKRLRREGLRSEPVVSPGLIDVQVDVGPVSPAGQPPYILYAGRHIPDKRVDTLPAAVAAARRDVPGLRLVILGAGPSTPTIRSAVEQVDGGAWTDFPGFVEDSELDRLMHGALCLANPSRREGYGLVVVEANAHGTPVLLVADEGNAATELIEDGVNGFVAPSTEPGALAEAIRRVAESGGALRATARSWHDQAVSMRTIRRTVGGILTELDRPARPSRKTKAETT